MSSKPIRGLLTADYQAGSRLCAVPPGMELPTLSASWSPSEAQRYLWDKWQNMIEILPKELDFYVHLGETLQGPSKKQGSTYEVVTNDVNEQIDIAEAVLSPIVERVKDAPDGNRAFWICRGSGWHEGEYGRAADLVAMRMGAHKFPNGEYSGDVLDHDWDGIICNFSHHASVFMIYFSTPMEREIKFYAEGEEQVTTEVDGQEEAVRPDLVARAHSHRHIAVERENRVAIAVPGWQLTGRYPKRRSPARAWANIGFTLVWLDPEAKRKGRRCIWHETVFYPHPKRKAIKLR